MSNLEDLLFYKLKELILEQSEGEWTDEMIVRDAHHFANNLRPLLQAAPASPLPGGGWQDIRTAPRQECVMLGHKDFKGWFCLAICNALGEWSYDDRPWGQQDAPDKEATHWRPLPAAPTGDA